MQRTCKKLGVTFPLSTAAELEKRRKEKKECREVSSIADSHVTTMESIVQSQTAVFNAQKVILSTQKEILNKAYDTP
jgi:hypothetical protein